MTTSTKVPSGLVDRLIATPDFIQRNNLRLIRTQEEVVQKMLDTVDQPLNFVPEVIVLYLSKENLNAGLEEKVSDWTSITTIEETAQDFLDYLNFGWEKAFDQRGLSAGRTIDKLGAWLWLMGRDDLVKLISDESLHDPYGMPALIAVSEKLGIDIPQKCHDFAAED